jgi:hypothetical protein
MPHLGRAGTDARALLESKRCLYPTRLSTCTLSDHSNSVQVLEAAVRAEQAARKAFLLTNDVVKYISDPSSRQALGLKYSNATNGAGQGDEESADDAHEGMKSAREDCLREMHGDRGTSGTGIIAALQETNMLQRPCRKERADSNGSAGGDGTEEAGDDHADNDADGTDDNGTGGGNAGGADAGGVDAGGDAADGDGDADGDGAAGDDLDDAAAAGDYKDDAAGARGGDDSQRDGDDAFADDGDDGYGANEDGDVENVRSHPWLGAGNATSDAGGAEAQLREAGGTGLDTVQQGGLAVVAAGDGSHVAQAHGAQVGDVVANVATGGLDVVQEHKADTTSEQQGKDAQQAEADRLQAFAELAGAERPKKFSSTVDTRKEASEKDPRVPGLTALGHDTGQAMHLAAGTTATTSSNATAVATARNESPPGAHGEGTAEVGAAAATDAATVAHDTLETGGDAALHVVAVGDEDVLKKRADGKEDNAEADAAAGHGALKAAQQHEVLQGAHAAADAGAHEWGLQTANQTGQGQ